MPDYIYEAKKRLGLIKQPHIAPNIEPKKKHSSDTPVAAPPSEILNNQHENVEKPANKHWQNWDNPSTPEKIREIRSRLGDDRYKKMRRSNTTLATYETKKNSQNNSRPQTSFEINTENISNDMSMHNSNNIQVTTSVTLNENEAATGSFTVFGYKLNSQNKRIIRFRWNVLL